MTIQSFLDFFNGIYCDYDGAYGDQCFDLANAYSRWIGGQRFSGATADLIFNQPGDFYIQIPNTLDYVPQKGDIIIWNWPHVGIATGNNSDTNQFEVLEQNDPGGSNCHIKIYHNYNGVLGALRPKQLPQNSDQTIIDQLRTERDTNWNLYTAEQQKNTDLQNQLTDCQNKVVIPVSEVTSSPEVISSTPVLEVLPSTSGDNMSPVETKPIVPHDPVKPRMDIASTIVWVGKNIFSVLIKLWKNLNQK